MQPDMTTKLVDWVKWMFMRGDGVPAVPVQPSLPRQSARDMALGILSLRCQPGDLAVIVTADSRAPQWLGRLVRVVRLEKPGGAGWVCDPAPEGFTAIGDEALRPIRFGESKNELIVQLGEAVNAHQRCEVVRIRPTDWHLIWPELADHPDAPAQPAANQAAAA